jgi:hypothetical protein
VALVREHSALRTAIAPYPDCDVPSVYACYRFAAKLRIYSDMLDRCIDRVTGSLHAQLPEYGRNVAIDASDMPAYANGQRFVSKNGPERERYSDPDASWGHRSAVSTRKGGGFYGYRIHASVCTATDLPVAWTVATAREHESTFVASLLDTVRERGFAAETCALDKGYDNGRVYRECADRQCVPVIPLRETPDVQRGDHKPPTWRTRPVALRRSRRQARREQVALPDRRLQARVGLDQGLPAAPADPARDARLHRPLPSPRFRRAGVRSSKA